MSYPDDPAYHSKWKKIVNVLKNQKIGSSRVAQAGSRARRQHRRENDHW